MHGHGHNLEIKLPLAWPTIMLSATPIFSRRLACILVDRPPSEDNTIEVLLNNIHYTPRLRNITLFGSLTTPAIDTFRHSQSASLAYRRWIDWDMGGNIGGQTK